MENEVMVSIICNTFNQEKYIADALEGFMKQKTSFVFEVCIHDDASTDHTSDVVREYEKKYPEFIKPIYQTENQYSQGKSVTNINVSRAKGKYLAFCEGDDYWIDPLKLQKQVDYMENNPRCSFCFTNGKVIGRKNGNIIPWSLECRKAYKVIQKKEELSPIDLIDMEYIPTASFMILKKVFLTIPEFPGNCFNGDMKWILFSTAASSAHYINDISVVYRYGVDNSATSKWKKEGKEKHIEVLYKFLNLIDTFDEATDYKYSHELNIRKYYYLTQEAMLKKDIKLLLSKEAISFSRSKGILFFIKYLLKVAQAIGVNRGKE